MRIFDFVYEVREGLTISFQAIRANAMRSVLTTLGIVIGIVSVTLMGTAIEGLSRGANSSIAKLGVDVLYVQKWTWFGEEEWWKVRNRRDLRMKEFRAIERHATRIRAACPAAGTMTLVKYQNRNSEGVTLIGVNEKYPEIMGIGLEIGRFFLQTEADGGRPLCVLGADVAEKLFPQESPLGKSIKIGPSNFRVLGVLEKQGSFLGLESLDNRVFIPISSFLRQFGSRHGLSILAKIADLQQLEESKEELRGVLRKARRLAPGAEDDFAINQQEAFLRTFNTIGAGVAGVGLFITALSLFVGAIGIMNIMFVSVTERTKEIGIRKALGAKRRTILLQFLLEAATLSLMGGILGVMIAYPLSLLVNQIMPTSMPISVVAIALAISIAVGIFSGFLPAFRASKLNPVETLRYE